MSMYFDIICLNSGLEARAQSMQRVAPWRISKANRPGVVLFVFDWGADGFELEFVGESSQFFMQRDQLGRNFAVGL